MTKVHIFIVGNKNDLYANEKVKKEEAIQYSKSINASCRIVSALNGGGIKELFEDVARDLMLNKFNNNENNANENDKDKNSNITLSKNNIIEDNKKKKKKKCC